MLFSPIRSLTTPPSPGRWLRGSTKQTMRRSPASGNASGVIARSFRPSIACGRSSSRISGVLLFLPQTGRRTRKLLKRRFKRSRPPTGSPPDFLEITDRIATEFNLHHWHVAFPHVFSTEPATLGRDLVDGFDVVLGNPPWERVEILEHEFFGATRPDIAAAPSVSVRKRLIAASRGRRPRPLVRVQDGPSPLRVDQPLHPQLWPVSEMWRRQSQYLFALRRTQRRLDRARRPRRVHSPVRYRNRRPHEALLPASRRPPTPGSIPRFRESPWDLPGHSQEL